MAIKAICKECGYIKDIKFFHKQYKPPYKPKGTCKKCHSLYVSTKNKEKKMEMYPWRYYQCEECCFIIPKSKVKDNKCPQCGLQYKGE